MRDMEEQRKKKAEVSSDWPKPVDESEDDPFANGKTYKSYRARNDNNNESESFYKSYCDDNNNNTNNSNSNEEGESDHE
jgi:hypothetical protein